MKECLCQTKNLARLCRAMIILFMAFGPVGIQALPAFPGAQGFGSQTPGGRGGKIVEVTNLNDRGPGSFREACEQVQGKRIIVFRVGGVIALVETGIQLIGDSITIAGQTAPGGGIVIKNASLVTFGHDIIIRGLRFRPGDDTVGEDPEVRDCLGIFGPEVDTAFHGGYNIIVDHCSMSWGIDENVSVWFKARDITFQWCIISEALLNSIHPKGGHGMGFLVGPSCQRITFHHSLLAHNNARVPLVCSGTTTEFINNVVYNWGYKAEFSEAHGSGPLYSNFIGNYYKPKTDPMDADGKIPFTLSSGILDSMKSRLFMKDNFCASVGVYMTPVITQAYEQALPGISAVFPSQSALPETSGVTVHPNLKAYDTVLAMAGAVLPVRDAADARVVRDTRDSTGKLIDCVGPNDLIYPVGRVRGATDSTVRLDGNVTLGWLDASNNPSNPFAGKFVEITAGKGAGQRRAVVFYVGYDTSTSTPTFIDTLQVATVDTPWNVVPDTSSRYGIVNPCANNAGGWPVYASGTAPPDADHDGMPDSWETANGLNPLSAADAAQTGLSPAGYTNVEVYINGLFDSLRVSAENWGADVMKAFPKVWAVPNPLHSGTVFHLSLSTAAPVSVDVYSLNGSLVRTLLKGAPGQAGRQAVAWDGKDGGNRPLGSGIYVCVLRAGGRTHRTKIAMLK